MKYENRSKVELILNGIKIYERKTEEAKEIIKDIKSDYYIELCVISQRLIIRKLSLTTVQMKYVINNIIEECNKKVEEYKEQLKDL